jgi:ABC-type proline/glycine betaine transport system substrate-binding protein
MANIILDSKEIANAYLKNTDWYYARKMEIGKEVPQDVVDNRAAAREYINRAQEV